MPLGARDVFIVIHAKDQASRVIEGVGRSFTTLDDKARAAAMRTINMGTAMVGMGVAIGAVGAAGVAAYVDMAKAAMDYNNQAALTLTQVDQLGVTLEDVKNIGREVANAVPAPFNQMQAALFDIFSSMDVNVNEAKQLLAGFSKAAVAGGTDVQTAGRSTIAILNGFHLPVTDMNKVLDVQFQLVRKGVGTYEEFATSIGRVIPSASRAGQNLETMAGALAFATRNGLSTEMAATAVARAMDAMTNTKVVNRLKALGVNALDQAGNFRQINDVITDLAKKFEGLTKPEIAARLQDLFKGAGGTIQARRFIDLAIQQFDELNQRVQEMIHSSGALEDAYKIMLKDPKVMMQALSNTWGVLKTEIGDAVIPVLLMLATGLKNIFQWFNNLPASAKKWIAWIGLAASGIMVLVGALLVVSGALLIFSGTLDLLGISVGLFALAFTGVAIAIGVAVAEIVKHWDGIKAWVDEHIPELKAAWKGFVDWLSNVWDTVVQAFETAMGAITDWLDHNWPNIWAAAVTAFDVFKDAWEKAWPVIKDVASTVWDWLKQNAPKVFNAAWGAIKGAAIPVYNWIKDTFLPFITGPFWQAMQDVWDWILRTVPDVWDKVKESTLKIYNWFKDTFIPFMSGPFWQTLQNIWDWITNTSVTVWNVLRDAVQGVWDKMQEFWDWCQKTFGPGLADLWQHIKTDVGPIIGDFRDIFIQTFKAIKVVVEGAMVVFILLKQIWDFIWPEMSKLFKENWDYITALLGAALDIITGLLDVFAGLVTGDWSRLWGGIQKIFGGIWDGIVAQAKRVFDILNAEAQIAWQALQVLWDHVLGALQSAWNSFSGWLGAMWAGFWGSIKTVASNIWTSLQVAWQVFWSVMQSVAVAALAPLAVIVGAVVSIIGTIHDIIQRVIDIAKQVWGVIVGAFGGVLNASGITGPLGTIISFIDNIISKAQTAIGFVHTLLGIAGGGSVAAAAAKIQQQAAPAKGSTTTIVPSGGGSQGAKMFVNARGGLVWPGMSTTISENGSEMLKMGTGGSYGLIVPHALASRTVSAQSFQGAGSVVVLQVQGPISDRNDLVYRASDALDWYDFTRGR